MIGIRDYYLSNSIKINKYTFVPKQFLAGYCMLHKGEKAGSIFKRFASFYGSNQTYRAGFADFVSEDMITTSNSQVIGIKNPKYKNAVLSEDYPFSYSLSLGLNLIKEFLGVESLEQNNEIVVRRLMNAHYYEVESFIEKHSPNYNCGINQALFDFVIARDYLFNKKQIEEKEITYSFYRIVIYSELFEDLIKNIRPTNSDKCLYALRSLGLNSYDARFNITGLDELVVMDINELFYHLGSTIHIVMNTIDYFSEDVDEVLPHLVLDYFSKMDDLRYEVIERRETTTLEAIGQEHGLTRERIRQLESGEIQSFNEFYDNYLSSEQKSLLFLFPRVSSVFYLQSFKDQFGSKNNAFLNLLKSINYGNGIKYYPELDSIVESEGTYSYFLRIVDDVFGDVFKADILDSKIEMSLEYLNDYGFTKEIVNTYIQNIYFFKNNNYTKYRSGMSNVSIMNKILEEHFDDGLHCSDISDIQKLNEYCLEEYGYEAFASKTLDDSFVHTLLATVGRADTRLVDRGTYVHVSKAPNLPFDIVEEIVKYVNDKDRPVAYSNIYETFKEVLNTFGIFNKYALQGALSPYKDTYFEGKRDYVSPNNVNKTLRQSIHEWISSRPDFFKYNDFQKEFVGVAQSVFMTALCEFDNIVHYWSRGYIRIEALDISLEEKKKLHQLLSFLINQYPNECCSADEIYNLVDIQMSEFLKRKYVGCSYDLYGILQLLFKGMFQFKRPIIGSLTAKFESKLVLLDEYLAPKDIVDLTKLRNYLDIKGISNNNNYVTIIDVIKEKWNEFVAIDVNTIVRKETLNIDDNSLLKLDVVVDVLLEGKEKINIEDDIASFAFQKGIGGMKANKYLIFGLINTYLHNKYDVIVDGKYRGGDFYIVRRKEAI